MAFIRDQLVIEVAGGNLFWINIAVYYLMHSLTLFSLCPVCLPSTRHTKWSSEFGSSSPRSYKAAASLHDYSMCSAFIRIAGFLSSVCSYAFIIMILWTPAWGGRVSEADREHTSMTSNLKIKLFLTKQSVIRLSVYRFIFVSFCPIFLTDGQI